MGVKEPQQDEWLFKKEQHSSGVSSRCVCVCVF